MTTYRGMSFLAYLLLFASLAYGQAVNGSLVGTITDSSGAAVPNAKVSLSETRTGLNQSTTSNQSGNYSFNNLTPGAYKVEVEVQGFRKAVKSGLDVLVNSTVRADLELTPGAVNEVVTVSADVAVLQTDRSDTGRKIETRQLADLPLTYNRNFQSLVNLVPGTIRAFRPHSEFFNVQDSLSTRVNGQSRLSNNVQLEGVDNNQRTGLLTAMIPPIEALQTVDVTTSNYEAELGRAGGAVTNVNFKSGTNEIHGSLFEFNKVSRLGARSFFASTKPVTTYNMFGGTIGGPIIRNKTFYFADFQGIRDRRGDNFIYTIPTAAFRTGNLSAGAQPIYDPASGDADSLGRTPFAGNIIPANRISPISARVLALIPAPNRGAQLNQNFEISTVRKKDTNGGDVKVDHQLSANDRLSVRYSIQKSEIYDPPLYGERGGGPRDFAGTGIQKAHSAAVNYTRVWSPTWLTEIRTGVMYYRNNADNADRQLKTAEEIGIRGVNVSDFTGGVSSFNVNGFSNPIVGYSASLPWERGETNLNFVINNTKTLGNHTIKFGVDYRRNRDELLQNQTFNPRGRYTFNEANTQLVTRNAAGVIGVTGGTTLANSFASFLLDRPNQFGRDLPLIFPTFLQRPWFSYVQDKWQVNQKLTVDLGMRHELWPPAVPRVAGGFSNYDPDTNSLVIAGVGANPMNLGRKNYATSFAPRFGAAYRHNDKTVLRMGYGISWAPLVDNGYAFNFPVRENNSFEARNAWSPAGAMADGFPPFRPFPIPQDGIIRNAPAQVYNVIPKDVREAYIQSWNFTIQRQLPKNLTLDVAYVGNHGVGVKATYNLNAGFVPNAGAAGRPLNARFGRLSDTNNIYFSTSTNYHSLQVKLDRRFSNGFSMTTAYTWAKAIDLSGADNGGLWVYINPQRNRARADGDRRHVFVQSYVYELPFGKGKKFATSGISAHVLGGWQVNGVLSFMTGEPFGMSVPGGVINAPGNSNTPNLVGEYKVLKAVGPGTFWFDPTAFAQPASGTFGNLGRNILSGPGFANLDASIFRTFTITERFKAQFRAEAVNFSNTPHFNNPNGDITSPNFGRVTGVNGAPNGPREVQLGLKVTF
ncbi:MAG: TonB-dependent receptor [Bryobacterales bacterium]|nr:TonB-dependent receptor [Bryobacterales bacterium]